MDPHSKAFRRVETVLAERESARRAYSATASRSPIHRLSPEQAFYSVSGSLKNRYRNRYPNVFAYDRTALMVDGEEFVHANVVADDYGRWWVASQAPPPDEMGLFFRAISCRTASSHPSLPIRGSSHPRRRAAIIVQLTGCEEGGFRKADPYLPESSPIRYAVPHRSSTMLIRKIGTKRLTEMSTTSTHLELSKDGGSKQGAGPMTIWHYQFNDWPDHGVPTGKAVEELRRLVFEVERKRREEGGGDEDGCEVWVHCSAGVGRTGTFIALSSLLISPGAAPLTSALPSPLGPLPKEHHDDHVAQTVDSLREWRGMMVQTSEQLALIYEMVSSGRR